MTKGELRFDPVADRANPYHAYAHLRAADPVHYDPGSNTWVLTRYEDVQAVLRNSGSWANDHSGSANHQQWLTEMGAGPIADELLSKILLFMDPPDHTRVRNLVTKAFTPRRVNALRPVIESTLEDLLEPATSAGEMDVISDLAFPFPVTIICQLLGVPVEDRDLFRQRTRDLTVLLEWQVTPTDFEASATAAVEFAAYFLALFEQRRSEPRDDLISALVAAEHESDMLAPEELLTTCILLLSAGHETTMNLIGNGLLALLRHPDQLALLRSDPSVAVNAVEELLRYDSPVQLTARTAQHDNDVDGQTIRQGEQVVTLLGAANRDPQVFSEPDRVELARSNANQHVSFGAGHHFCLGAALARVEAQIALPKLAQLSDLELATEEPEWRKQATLRGLEHLPIRFRPTGSGAH
jgi:cytochrome P450